MKTGVEDLDPQVCEAWIRKHISKSVIEIYCDLKEKVKSVEISSLLVD